MCPFSLLLVGDVSCHCLEPAGYLQKDIHHIGSSLTAPVARQLGLTGVACLAVFPTFFFVAIGVMTPIFSLLLLPPFPGIVELLKEEISHCIEGLKTE